MGVPLTQAELVLQSLVMSFIGILTPYFKIWGYLAPILSFSGIKVSTEIPRPKKSHLNICYTCNLKGLSPN